MAHHRLPGADALPPPLATAVRAGNHISLGGLAGFRREGGFTGPGDPAAQADQAMQTARVLLEQAGSRMEHIRKLTIYVTDRAWLGSVAAIIDGHLARVAPARVELIVNGLGAPEMLVAIDADAIVPEP